MKEETREGFDPLMTQIYDLLAAPVTRSLTVMIEERQGELGISDRQLSQILRLPRPSLDRIKNGEAQKLDVLTLLKISQFLGVREDEILQVIAAGMKPEDVGELERARAASFLVRNFNLPKLKQIGLVDSIADLSVVNERITRFLGLRSIFEYTSEVGYSLFSRVKRPFGDRMLEFWVKSAYRQFERINNPHDFDPATLRELVPQIRQYTRYEQKGLLTVVRALYKVGVTVIVQTYLPRTSVRGGTFVINGKPCIVLTNRGNLYPTIWFTLLHELGHVIFHWDKLKTLKYHVSGGDDLFLVEEEANYFAQELLLPSDKLNYIKTYIEAPGVVYKYAEECNVHPSIIYAFYAWEQHRGGDKDAFRNYSKYMPSADAAVATLCSHPWNKDTIEEEADRVKALLTKADEEPS